MKIIYANHPWLDHLNTCPKFKVYSSSVFADNKVVTHSQADTSLPTKVPLVTFWGKELKKRVAYYFSHISY